MSNKIAVDISFGEIDNNLQSADLQVFLDSSNNINLRGRKKQELYTIGIDLLCFKIENQVGNVILSNNLNNYTLEKRTNNYILKFNYIGDRITISNTEDLSNVVIGNIIEKSVESEPEAESKSEPTFNKTLFLYPDISFGLFSGTTVANGLPIQVKFVTHYNENEILIGTSSNFYYL